MRTTIRLKEELLTAAKTHATRTGRTLTALLEDALRALLVLESRKKTETVPELPTYGGGGVLPGVDLDNSADLLDVMEGTGAAR